MAVFDIDRINYVVAGNQVQIVNLDIYRLDTSREGGGSGDRTMLLSNMTFFSDMGVLEDRIDHETRTHSIRKWMYDPEAKEYVNGEESLVDGTLVCDLFDAKDLLYGRCTPMDIIRDEPGDGEAVEEDAGGEESGDGLPKMADSRKMIDVYSPKFNENFLGFVQLGGNSFFGMSPETEQDFYTTHTTLRDDRLHRLSNDSGKLFWNYKLSTDLANTFTYAPLSDLRVNSYNHGQDNYDPNDPIYTPGPEVGYYGWATSYKGLSMGRLSSLFDNKFNMTHISMCYMFEGRSAVGGNVNDIRFPDFNRAVVQTDQYIGKNQFNSEYGMVMPNQTSLSAGREYIGVGVTGGSKPFLKYYDDYDYEMIDIAPDSGKPKNFPLPSLSVEGMQTMEMERHMRDENLRPYQSVEIFDSNNRGINSCKHKSNLYSIEILNTKLDTTNVASKNILNKIRTDIRNTVRKIADRLNPAHTQLFNVNFGASDGGISTEDRLEEMFKRKLVKIEISRDGATAKEEGQ